ncbi:hypothetical protein EJB05_05294, partial [Eragrostis curvula]
MASARGSAAFRVGRWLLWLAVPACCVLWMLLVLAPRPPELAVGEIVGTGVERWGDDTRPAPGSEEIVDMPEREQVIGMPVPPPEREVIIDMSPPPPKRGRIIDASPSPKREVWYIYIHDLPRRFNADLVRRCRSLSEWTEMCKHVANAGMGPRLTRTGGVLPSTGWYDTNQFTVEVIFHSRMRRYGFLTPDACLAAAVYVPYYAGLDVGRHLWGSFGNAARDALAEDLAAWLRSWAAHGGRDHFLVAGRIAWDFRREEQGGDWGSRLLLPEAWNMTALVLESGPWHAATDVAVPYPTYFHPSRGGAEVASWQRAVRRARRPWLFAFATTLRDAVMDQCARSPRCGLLQCGGGQRDDC